MAVIDFKEAFDEWVKHTDKVWAHDRTKTVGASEAFGCMRKSWFAKNGGEVNKDYEKSWGALRRGDIIEQHHVAPAITWFLEAFFNNARLIWAGDDQITHTSVDAPLTATPDGLVIDADDDALAHYGIPSLGGTGCFHLEIKSVDPRVNLKEEKAIHRGQTIVQMGLTRETTEYRPNYAVILYVDASFFDDMEVFIVPFDPKTFEIAKVRAREVFAKPLKAMTPEGKIDGGCEYCQFSDHCARELGLATPKDGEANAKNTPTKLMVELEELLKAERSAASIKKSTEAEHKEASERLKSWLRDVGVRQAVVPGVGKVSISFIKGRKSLDKESLREACEAKGIDMDDHMVEGAGHDRLNISEKGPSVADET